MSAWGKHPATILVECEAGAVAHLAARRPAGLWAERSLALSERRRDLVNARGGTTRQLEPGKAWQVQGPAHGQPHGHYRAHHPGRHVDGRLSPAGEPESAGNVGVGAHYLRCLYFPLACAYTPALLDT